MEENQNKLQGSLIGALHCDFCKRVSFLVCLFQQPDGKYFLGLNCIGCGADVTGIRDIQEYALLNVKKLVQ